jgi:hypothetical protein
LIDKLIDVEKRLDFNEYKRNKDKKRVKKVMNDIYGDENPNEKVEVIKEDKKEQQNGIENKLKDAINEGEEEVENNKIND